MIWLLSAFAQDGAPIDAEAFRASSDATRTLATDEGQVRPGWIGSAAVHYQREPLIYELDGDVTRLVRDAIALDLAGSFSAGPLRVGLTAPVYLLVTSDTDPSRTVLGDPGLHAKLQLTKGRFDLGLIGAVDLPLGAHRYYLGSSTVAGRFGLAANLDAGPLYVVLNAGVQTQGAQELENVRLGNGLYVRAAVGIQASTRVAIALESLNRINLLTNSVFDNSSELMLGIHRTGPGISPYASVGTALTPSVGSPRIRAMLGLRIAPGVENR